MLWSVLISVGLFVGLLGGLEVGLRIGRWIRLDKDSVGSGPADGVVFAVFGLIVAFTFSASASRFNERRRLIVEQANALGTAAVRLDALDRADRPPIRRPMLRWTELAQRIPASGDEASLNAVVTEAAQAQSEVWRLAAAAVERKREPALWAFVMSPINDWIDLTTTRLATNNLGAPPVVMPTVVVLSLVASVLAGFHMSQHERRSWLQLAFAGIVALLIYVIFDLNHPRSGLIRVDAMDQTIREVEQSRRQAQDQG
jgi:hypothetical protein